jgi:uncharacterized membrane-anchored protein
MASLRKAILWINLAVIAAAFFYLVKEKEALLAEGAVVRLELAPVDPRSLLQGDYMNLRYKVVQEIGHAAARNGYVVGSLGAGRFGTYARVQDAPEPLAANEAAIRYRYRGSQAKIGAESFLFQEGKAKALSLARFAELRVSPKGQTLLTGLLDKDGNALR